MHRAHSVFVGGALQAEASPVCCSALLRVRSYLLSGFDNQTCVGSPPCFIFISKEITSTTDFLSHHPPLASTVACAIPTVAHGYLRPRRAFFTPLRLCHVVLFLLVGYTYLIRPLRSDPPGAGRGETAAFESFIPLYYVHLIQQHAQQPPLLFLPS